MCPTPHYQERTSIPVSDALPAPAAPNGMYPIPIGIGGFWLQGPFMQHMTERFKQKVNEGHAHGNIGYGFRPRVFSPQDIMLDPRPPPPYPDWSTLDDEYLQEVVNEHLSQTAIQAVVDTGSEASTPVACTSVDLFAAYPGSRIFALVPEGALDSVGDDTITLGVVPAIPGLPALEPVDTFLRFRIRFRVRQRR